MKGLRAKAASRKRASDEVRDQRLAQISDLTEGFSYVLAELLAGRTAELERYADPGVALRVRSTVAPFLESGKVIRPDFGPYGELRLEGDLLCDDGLVNAVLEFEDRSFEEGRDGRLTPVPRRRVQLCMQIPLASLKISALEVRPLV